MPLLTVDPLPPGCPWSGWTPPNVDWCEEQLCSWVVNPADTWSNLAYGVVGVLMILRARRLGDPRLGHFGPASLAVGVGSLVYHASYTYFFQFFDFVGMFLFCFAVITPNAIRLGWVRPERKWSFLAGGVLISSGLVPLLSETPVPIQLLIAALIVFTLWQEWTIRRRRPADEAPEAYRFFGLGLLLLTVAALASLLDVTRVWCDPQNHWISGHAVWHVLTAAALLAFFEFYARLSRR